MRWGDKGGGANGALEQFSVGGGGGVVVVGRGSLGSGSHVIGMVGEGVGDGGEEPGGCVGHEGIAEESSARLRERCGGGGGGGGGGGRGGEGLQRRR